MPRWLSLWLLFVALAHVSCIQAAIPVSAEFVPKAPDPRGGDAGFNTFQRLPDGRGITFGGFSHDRNGNNAVVAYDPVGDAWQVLQPNLPWIDTYDVTGRSFLGNRDDHVTLIVDNQYWAIDGQRGVPLLGNYRGVFDVASRTWTIDDDAALFSPTGTFFGVWMLSAADWHACARQGLHLRRARQRQSHGWSADHREKSCRYDARVPLHRVSPALRRLPRIRLVPSGSTTSTTSIGHADRTSMSTVDSSRSATRGPTRASIAPISGNSS